MLSCLCALLWAAASVDAQFNTSFEFVLDSLSPMLHFNYSEWTFDPESNSSLSVASNGNQSSTFSASFVGQEFRIGGTVNARTQDSSALGSVHIGESVTPFQNTDHEVLAEWTARAPEVVDLQVTCPAGSADCTVHNVTINVPVRTQA